MADKRINCQITVPDALVEGTSVNAFRAVRVADGDWILDFLVHSAKENKAVVVARVRGRPEFLEAVRDRLDSTLQESSSGGKKILSFPVPGNGKAN